MVRLQLPLPRARDRTGDDLLARVRPSRSRGRGGDRIRVPHAPGARRAGHVPAAEQAERGRAGGLLAARPARRPAAGLRRTARRAVRRGRRVGAARGAGAGQREHRRAARRRSRGDQEGVRPARRPFPLDRRSSLRRRTAASTTPCPCWRPPRSRRSASTWCAARVPTGVHDRQGARRRRRRRPQHLARRPRGGVGEAGGAQGRQPERRGVVIHQPVPHAARRRGRARARPAPEDAGSHSPTRRSARSPPSPPASTTARRRSSPSWMPLPPPSTTVTPLPACATARCGCAPPS